MPADPRPRAGPALLDVVAGPRHRTGRPGVAAAPSGGQLPAGTNAIGGYWTRTNNPEVDIVAADREPAAKTVTMVGSVKWLEQRPFDDHGLARLVLYRSQVPGADDTTPLIAVSRSGASSTAGLLVLSPDEPLTAYR